MPVALISTRTSPAFGPSRSSSMISSGFFASNATAARGFILHSTFALQDILAIFGTPGGPAAFSRHSFFCHACIFGLLDGGWFVFMLGGAPAGDCVVGAGPQVDIDVVEVADHVLIVAERRHDVFLRRGDV